MSAASSSVGRGSRCRSPVGSVSRTIKDFRSYRESRSSEAFGLVMLAGASLAEAAWLVDGEVEPETVFEHGITDARAGLKRQIDRLQTQLSAGSAQKQKCTVSCSTLREVYDHLAGPLGCTQHP
jgi:hypothetical protein